MMVLLSFSISPQQLSKTKPNGALPKTTKSALQLLMVLPNGAVMLVAALSSKLVPLVRLISRLLLTTTATTDQLPLLLSLTAGLPPWKLADLTIKLQWNSSLTASGKFKLSKPPLVAPTLFAEIPSSCTNSILQPTQPGQML
jgi:hypothetical protein